MSHEGHNRLIKAFAEEFPVETAVAAANKPKKEARKAFSNN